MDRKKKGKYVGLAGALLVHVVVIALLILVGFTLPEQSEEGGVPVMMGEVPDAWGAADPSLVEVDVMPEETAPEMPEEVEQDMLTQEEEETVAIKPKAEEKKKEAKILFPHADSSNHQRCCNADKGFFNIGHTDLPHF